MPITNPAMLSESKYLVDFLVGFLGKKPQILLFPIYSTIVLYDTPKLQGLCLQSLGRNIVCNKHGCRMPQLKISRFSIKMCASQPDGQQAHQILHTGTWLRGEHSGKCCYNSVMLQATN